MGIQVLPDNMGGPFGRIGRGFGKGLAESIPKEVERSRLSAGLKDLSQTANNRTPLESYAQIASLPGVTPSMLQALPDIIRQQKQGEALSRAAEERKSGPSPFPTQEKPSGKGGESITTTQPIKATVENYIPPSRDDILERAGELYKQNPQLYPTPQDALQGAEQEAQQDQAINTALQNQRKGQQDVQTRVQQELQTQAQNLGVDIPGNVLSDIENKALDAVKSGKMTELEAAKHFGKELDAVSRDYKAIETLGTWRLFTKDSEGNKGSLKSLQKKFKSRNDLENFADSMIAQNKLSPSKAYYLAYPVSESKELNNEISKLPSLKPELGVKRGYPKIEIQEDIPEKTREISERIASKMSFNDSPLAIAEELKSRGYDPKVWMDYVTANKRKLKLSATAERELDKPRDFTNTLDDMWMFYFSGLDKLVEQ